MSNSFNKTARDLARILQNTNANKPSPYDTQAEVRRIDGNTAWVHIPGGIDETPVQLTTSAKKGDIVQVRVSGGRAWLYGNKTSPPTDDTKANEADKKAGVADEHAIDALEATIKLDGRVKQAEENVTIIENDIVVLDGRVDQADANITTIEDNVSGLTTRVSDAESDITTIEGNVSGLNTRVTTAEGNITTIEGNISGLNTRVGTAEGNITTIEGDISGLTTRVSDAEDDIDDTLKGLALAQDVIGTLAWITAHSTVTSDTTPISGKAYYIKNQDGTFTLVTDTTGKNPHNEGWYEMDEAMANYVAAHLAMTNDGLVVTKDNSKWKVLVKDNGIDIIDATSGINKVIASYGAGIEFDDEREFHIGNQHAYIVFNPSNGGSITIGGANITLGDDRSLDDVLASMNSTISNTLIYDHTYVYGDYINNKPTTATFTAFLYRGGVDVKNELDDEDNPKYPPSHFTWYLKKEDENGIKEIPIIVDPQSDPQNSGYQCTVNLSDCGYGAEVIGKFTSLDDAEALTNDGDNLTTVDDDPITVRASGDSVRVRDLTTSSTIFPVDKLMVVGSEDEHLVTIQTLQDYLNANLDKQVLFDTTANWNSQTTLVSRSDTLYIYTDHQRDSGGHAIAGIKAGDGLAYVVDLPFTDAIATEHIANSSIHITSSERSTWNNHVSNSTIHVTASDKEKWNSAVKCYYAGTDQLVFTVV